TPERARLLGMLDDELLLRAARFVRALQVVARIDVIELVADRRRVERHSVAGLEQPVAEVDVLSAEQAVAGEARVETAEGVEERARDRALPGEQVVGADLGAGRAQALSA